MDLQRVLTTLHTEKAYNSTLHKWIYGYSILVGVSFCNSQCFSLHCRSLSLPQLSVHDPDHGPNGRVTFKLNSDKFAVNTSSGVLYTTQPLDREQQALYQITIRATDGGLAAKVGEVIQT